MKSRKEIRENFEWSGLTPVEKALICIAGIVILAFLVGSYMAAKKPGGMYRPVTMGMGGRRRLGAFRFY